jgi:hypothetical protein
VVEVLCPFSQYKEHIQGNRQEENQRKAVISSCEWVLGHEDELLDEEEDDESYKTSR